MRILLAAVALLLGTACKGGSQSRAAQSSPPRLVAPTYADRASSVHADPEGVYWEGDRLWVWSGRHRQQRSYQRIDGRWQAGPTRRGPAGTERCVVGRAALEGRTFCVGRYENGGLVELGADASTGRRFGALPLRAGYRDLVLMHELGLVGVLDAVTDQLIWLDATGARVGQHALASASYRLGSAGGDLVFVLAGGEPRLTLLRVTADAATHGVARWNRTAPLRDGCYDAAGDVLWLAGPEDHAVRRRRGPIEHLGSELIALDAAALRRGEVHARARFALQQRGLADPTRLATFDGQVVASATGSDALAWLRPAEGGWQLAMHATGLGPLGLAGAGGVLAVATRLDDGVQLLDTRRPEAAPEVLTLDAAPRDAPRDVGERLFYGALLWSQSHERPFTCNSCHWDTESDRRTHPGFLESRDEQTRPVGGVGAIEPLFTPGQSPTLEAAVDGFLRILDDRYWRDRAFAEQPIRVPLKGGVERRVSPTDARRALSAFLAAVPVVPGPYLRAEDPDLRARVTRGAGLFLDACADCHAPRSAGRVLALASPQALMAELTRRPLVLGGSLFAHAGAGPSFTDRGNRVAPLMGLSRGGPYFASGRANRLADVVATFSRARPGVHGGTAPAYDAAQAADLEAFLHAL